MPERDRKAASDKGAAPYPLLPTVMAGREGTGDVDAAVRALLARRDPDEAATVVIRAFGEPIHRYLRSVLRNDDDAADAHSLWAERLWLGMRGFAGRSSVRTWAYRIACNVALSMRADAWHRRRLRLSTGKASILAAEERSRSVLSMERQRTALDELSAELSASDQSLLALRIDQGLPWDEVAEVLAEGGERVEVEALQKRFERLKRRIGKLARDRGLVE